MASIAETLTGLGSKVVLYGVIGLIVLLVIVGIIIFIVWQYKRKKWNLSLTVKLPRSDGRLVLTEKAKGYWDAKSGWIIAKRKGMKPVHTKPIDPKRWLKGTNSATLIQTGPEDFIIADELSYTVFKDVEGKTWALMDIVADIGKRKSWKTYTERAAKNAFTITSWLQEHWRAIELTVIIFVIFLGFAILWSRLPSICGK